MIKLFILNDVSPYSSDAVFKICLALENKGLTQESVVRFNSYDDLLDAIIPALEKGEHIIVSPETSNYNSVKRDIIGKLILQEFSSPVIAEIIALNAGDDLSEIDLTGHCLVPAESKTLISTDGLYSGFSVSMLSGKLSCIPLDFMRVDEILAQFIEKVIEREERLAQMGIDSEIEMPDYDLLPAVSSMVEALSSQDKTIALATSEATMWVYNLYDKVDELTERVKFVEVVDEDNAVAESETESAMVIRHAREAMLGVGADFGAAVSEIYSSETPDGRTVYFAFTAVVDKSTAKAKKINISDPENLAIILPHAITLMSDMVCNKIEVVSKALALPDTDEAEKPKTEEEKKPISNKLLIFAACAVVALILPIILVFTVFNEDEPTTAAPPVYNPAPITTQATTAPQTTNNPFGPQNPNNGFVGGNEPSAEDVSATQATTSKPSTSGVFTFYVFGYGHGVGMSQVGANYLAKNEGFNYAQILAHYYYDGNASIVSGDIYPEKITYAGSAYSTREYLAKALEAEMGPSFHIEALKAQAVAIYTFAKHYSYNLSADATAFTAGTPSNIVYQAVDTVMKDGLYISYAGDVALTPFHAMSAGVTTSYYNVWGKNAGTNVPYLSGGRVSPGDYLDNNFKSVYTITSADLKKLVEANSDLGVKLSGDPSTWLSIVTHDKAIREDIGYVSTINVGGKIITGNDFRIKVLGGRIRSHCFAMTYTPDA